MKVTFIDEVLLRYTLISSKLDLKSNLILIDFNLFLDFFYLF